jgi:small subunit ribosomal protein S16
MLKIRLSRTGKKNSPSFRIVVTEHYKPVKAGFIEHIGFYNPGSKQFQINKEKLDVWMKKGATCSTTVNNLLVREKIFKKDKVIKVTRTPKKKDEEEKKPEVKKEKPEDEKKVERNKKKVEKEPKPISNQKSQISNKK